MSVTLTVPGDHAGLFQREAAETLEYAAAELNELLRWCREADQSVTSDELADTRARVHAAETLFQGAERQMPSGEVRVDADLDALLLTLDGCLHEAAERVGELIEAARRPGWEQDVRSALAEVELWLALRESLGEA